MYSISIICQPWKSSQKFSGKGGPYFHGVYLSTKFIPIKRETSDKRYAHAHFWYIYIVFPVIHVHSFVLYKKKHESFLILLLNKSRYHENGEQNYNWRRIIHIRF